MEHLLADVNRKALAALAREGAKFENHGKMCGTCAFKLNSDANFEPHNVDRAWDCLATEGTFNCHVESGVDKGCECVGFKYAKAAFRSSNIFSLLKLRNMDVVQLANEVKKMRDLQNEYFQARNNDVLRKAKAQERVVDKIVDKILNDDLEE